MAALAKAIRIPSVVSNLTNLLTKLNVSTTPTINIPSTCILPRICLNPVSNFHTSARKNDIMEFFDDEKNWGKDKVRVGRSWKKDELRIKSNEDLHKLWYILLKEKNMLLTMEHACKKEFQYFPNPERIDKIQDSMENLETVVRERNIAYHQLEVGESGERPARIVNNQLGMRMAYRSQQHVIPQWMNTSWQKKHIFSYGGSAVQKFRKKYREKLWLEKRRARNREATAVKTLLRRYPNLDAESIKHRYPNVNFEKVKLHKNARGHYLPE